MKSYNLYFFRHGITKGNLNAQYIGHTDLPLTTDSINELHSIKAKYHYPKVDAVFSSPLKRCKDSAEIMFPDNTIITIDDFIEYNFGEFEQCTADDLKDNEDFKNWIGGDIHSKTPYGESNAEFAQRVCASFEKVIDGCIKNRNAKYCNSRPRRCAYDSSFLLRFARSTYGALANGPRLRFSASHYSVTLDACK